jgi:hypothetical protein
MRISTSSQEGMTGMRFILPPATLDKMCKRMSFKILNIKQQRTTIAEKWEANKVSPEIAFPIA